MTDENEELKIEILGIALVEAHFQIKDAVDDAKKLNSEYEISVEVGIAENLPPGNLETVVSVICKNKAFPDMIDLRVKAAGRFRGKPEHIALFLPNSAGLVMPYIRNYISTLTAWGPMNPLLVPPMNVRIEVPKTSKQ